MLTYGQIIDLKEKVDRDEISGVNAKEIYFADVKENQRSWHTKDWKERRKLFLKDKCEQCGGTEYLTLQNQTRPERYDKYYLNSFIYYHKLFTDEYEGNYDDLTTKEDILSYIEKTPRETFSMCPRCSGSYYKRRNKPQLVCGRCKYEFDEPVSKLLPEYIDDLYSEFDITTIDKPANAPGNRRIKHIMLYSDIHYNITIQKIKQIVKEKHQSAIDKKAMMDYLIATIKYLSFEDTKTLCRKCAFNQYKNERDLCPVCKKNYKPIRYKTCVDCLPEGELKNQIKEKIESYKEIREMEKNLGID
jgi:ribosomal protein S27AE